MSQLKQRSIHSKVAHRTLQKSSTLNRHYVKRPAVYTAPFESLSDQAARQNIKHQSSIAKTQPVSPKIESATKRQADALKRRQALAAQINQQNYLKNKLNHNQNSNLTAKTTTPRPTVVKSTTKTQKSPIAPARPNPYQAAIARRQAQPTKLSPQELKNQAVAKALESVQTPKLSETIQVKKTGRVKKLFFALTCSAACIFALGFLVKINIPDITVRVAAMQTGIEASYPSFVPNGFQLTNASSDQNGTVVLNFENQNKASFKISQKKSSWDSSALLNNFVKPEWRENYTIIREQGITIYLTDNEATWVNGGLLFNLKIDQDNLLSKQQIKDIITSL